MPQVTDFGLSKAFDKVSPDKIVPSPSRRDERLVMKSACGSAAYAAPELLQLLEAQLQRTPDSSFSATEPSAVTGVSNASPMPYRLEDASFDLTIRTPDISRHLNFDRGVTMPSSETNPGWSPSGKRDPCSVGRQLQLDGIEDIQPPATGDRDLHNIPSSEAAPSGSPSCKRDLSSVGRQLQFDGVSKVESPAHHRPSDESGSAVGQSRPRPSASTTVGRHSRITADRDSEAYNQSVDIWALGLVMCVLVTGEHPLTNVPKDEYLRVMKGKLLDFEHIKVTCDL